MTKHDNQLTNQNIYASQGTQSGGRAITETQMGSRRAEDFSRTIFEFATRKAAPPGDETPIARRTRTGPDQGSRQTRILDRQTKRNTMNTQHEHKPLTGLTAVTHLMKGQFKMKNDPVRAIPFITHKTLKRAGVSMLALMTATASVNPSWAAGNVDNSAVAVGTYLGADDTTSSPSLQAVPIADPTRNLDIVKTVASGPTTGSGSNGTITDGGDTITYQYVVTNTGNITETNVTPVEAAFPTFDGNAGTGSWAGGFSVTLGSAASVAPGASVTFERTYTMSSADVYLAAGITDAVDNIATASSDDHTDLTTSLVETTITGAGALTIAKVAVLDDTVGTVPLEAEVGETITYTYTVTNTGNVALTNVGVADTHEAVLLVPAPAGEDIAGLGFTDNGLAADSADATADDGVFDTLGPLDVVTFTYVHTVTQAEFDAQ